MQLAGADPAVLGLPLGRAGLASRPLVAKPPFLASPPGIKRKSHENLAPAGARAFVAVVQSCSLQAIRDSFPE